MIDDLLCFLKIWDLKEVIMKAVLKFEVRGVKLNHGKYRFLLHSRDFFI